MAVRGGWEFKEIGSSGTLSAPTLGMCVAFGCLDDIDSSGQPTGAAWKRMQHEGCGGVNGVGREKRHSAVIHTYIDNLHQKEVERRTMMAGWEQDIGVWGANRAEPVPGVVTVAHLF